MVNKDDWRLRGQEKFLFSKRLFWRKYKARSGTWEHDHCEFCWAKFMEDDYPDILTEGYTTEDNYYWVCRGCFEDFREVFQWQIEE